MLLLGTAINVVRAFQFIHNAWVSDGLIPHRQGYHGGPLMMDTSTKPFMAGMMLLFVFNYC
jgi:hypothetical protein